MFLKFVESNVHIMLEFGSNCVKLESVQHTFVELEYVY